jgi:hypothetical protein
MTVSEEGCCQGDQGSQRAVVPDKKIAAAGVIESIIIPVVQKQNPLQFTELNSDSLHDNSDHQSNNGFYYDATNPVHYACPVSILYLTCFYRSRKSCMLLPLPCLAVIFTQLFVQYYYKESAP